jgi:hypothetical protein
VTNSHLQLRPRNGFGLFVAFTNDEHQFLDQVLREFNDHYDSQVAAADQPSPPRASAEAAMI